MSKVHKIVVGVDGSESSVTALRWALGEARLRDAQVEAIHTWSLTPMVDPMGFASYVPVEELGVAAKNVVETVMKRVEEFVGKTKVSTKISRGPAAATLLEAAKDAELLVVGRRGHGGFMGLLLKSI
ncbi:MAG: universal stress protein [Actinobacteria bacterium]|nr:universal stress protein [Actinomycetota bacterium]